MTQSLSYAARSNSVTIQWTPALARFCTLLVLAAVPIVWFHFTATAAIDRLYASGYTLIQFGHATERYVDEHVGQPALYALGAIGIEALFVIAQVALRRWRVLWLFALFMHLF